MLAAVVGSTEIIDQPLVGNLDKAVDQIVWESSLEHLLESSPEIAARQASVKKAKTIVRRAQAESVPDINIQAILQQRVQTDVTIGYFNVLCTQKKSRATYQYHPHQFKSYHDGRSHYLKVKKQVSEICYKQESKVIRVKAYYSSPKMSTLLLGKCLLQL